MSFKKVMFLSTLLFFLHKSVKSQNLVVNGSFEISSACPTKKGALAINCEDIIAPTRGSTDYFHTCGPRDVGVPKNFNGEQEAYEGEAYAGLYLHSPNDYREYIQFKLKETLEKGKIYKVSIRLSIAESSVYAVQNMSVLFTQNALSLDTNENLSPSRLSRFNIKKYTYAPLKIKESIFNTKEWGLLEVEFEAKGYEQYLTFGNFKNNRYSRVIDLSPQKKKLKPMAFYYIDDVSVTLLKDKQYEIDKPFVLNKLQFKFDSFELTEEAKKDIRKVFLHLKRDPKSKLKIFGHTDNKGNELYNKYLSSRRARSVALYLELLGITPNRIVWEGKGDKVPLHANNSDKARDANRRVEFVITKFDDVDN